ncbi:unnamed protein product [Urochloa humidicola]
MAPSISAAAASYHIGDLFWSARPPMASDPSSCGNPWRERDPYLALAGVEDSLGLALRQNGLSALEKGV